MFINGERGKENLPEKEKNHFEIFFVSFVFTSHETVKEYNFEQLSYLLIDTLSIEERGGFFFCMFGLGLAHDLFLFVALQRELFNTHSDIA